MNRISREQLELQLAEQNPDWWDAATVRVGSKNRFTCDLNREHYIVTIDNAPGSTPSTIPCGTRFELGGCQGWMRSRMYGNSQRSKPGYEWWRPDSDALGRFGKNLAQNEHVWNGGLLLRALPDVRGQRRPLFEGARAA